MAFNDKEQIPPPRGPGRPPGPAQSIPKVAPKQGRSDDEWRKLVANAWTSVYLLIKFVALRLGFEETKPFDESMAWEDAIGLVPVLKDYERLVKVLSWIGAPFVLLRRLGSQFRRKPAAPKEAARKEPPGATIRPAT